MVLSGSCRPRHLQCQSFATPALEHIVYIEHYQPYAQNLENMVSGQKLIPQYLLKVLVSINSHGIVQNLDQNNVSSIFLSQKWP